MQAPEAYSILKNHFGSHSSAARALGLTPEHYRAIRNERVSIPDRTKNFIALKAQEISSPPPALSAGPPENLEAAGEALAGGGQPPPANE
ncbi:MAG: hypothetical protein LBC79_02295 [Deltaproteobacteria bacterium]|nr:hypothetical protein [Deltaproteobacteria bacterium]